MTPVTGLLSPSGRTALAGLTLIVLPAGLYLLSGDVKRALQISVLALPFAAAALTAQGASGLLRWSLRAAALLGFLILTLDAGVRDFLKHIYVTEPMSTFVLEAAANTSPEEALGFFAAQWPALLLWAGVSAAAFALEALLVLRTAPAAPMRPVLRWAWRGLLLVLFSALVLALAKPSWRSHLPFWFWPHWVQETAELQADWRRAEEAKRRELATARTLLTGVSHEPQTIVLVLGESTCRDNWSLYGYARATTPRLAHEAQSDPRLAVVRRAWSVDATTVSAFNSMLTFPVTAAHIAARRQNAPVDGMEAGSVLAFFAAAGWRIDWISNQDDRAVNARYAGWAAAPEFLNRMTGRTSVSLDGRVLPAFERALARPEPRKLIVVHLMGAHPHYALRYPARLAPDWGDDPVKAHLRALGRSPWVVISRNQYDAAMRYQDEVVAKLLELTRRRADDSGVETEWIYLSDHGQETGEAINRAGHSAATPAGYRVPMLMWSASGEVFKPLEERPFRTDRLSPLLLSLAGIHWRGEDEREAFTSGRWQWTPPVLGARDPTMPPAHGPSIESK